MHTFIHTLEESQNDLEQMVDNLPPDILRGLNGGIALLPDTIVDNDGLLVLGRYHVEPMGLGRYVTIHFGSLLKAYGHLPARQFREKLRGVLHHELTHHLESLAGDRSLEAQDAIDRHKYLRQRQNNLKDIKK